MCNNEWIFFNSSGCCIPGLEGKQLEFLGLLDCPDSPCERQNLPAKRVGVFPHETYLQNG